MTKAKVPTKAGGSGSSSGTKKASWFRDHDHLFSKDEKDFRIGRDIQPKRDLSRFVKWPLYVRLQRQRAILKKRLKVPPAIHQFSRTLDKNQAGNLFRLLSHYRPETGQEKKKRLLQTAKESKEAANKGAAAAGAAKKGDKPLFVKYGLAHITHLIEKKETALVVIAHDVDPVELVVWLPALCRKMGVPYCIVKGRARLGQLVHKKTATAVALTQVRKEDQAKLDQIIAAVRPLYNDDLTATRKWGGGILGLKAMHVIEARKRAADRELAKSAK
jgi:large subunit ribosomal protein L7Ae